MTKDDAEREMLNKQLMFFNRKQAARTRAGLMAQNAAKPACARNMDADFKALKGTHDEMLFATVAQILVELIMDRKYRLPIGIFMTDAKGTKVWGTYDWDDRNFALTFKSVQRESRTAKLTCPVIIEAIDGRAVDVRATVVVQEEIDPDSGTGKFWFEVR
jgi:hypothetical protein